MLPEVYSKDAQPFEHFDTPEELARHQVRMDIKSGWADHDQSQAGTGWYGHHIEIRHDKIIVMECAGKKMNEVYDYKKLVREERQKELQKTLFN